LRDETSTLVLAWLTGFAEIKNGVPRTRYLDDLLDKDLVLAARSGLIDVLRGDAPVDPEILNALADLIDPEDISASAVERPCACVRQRELVIRFRNQQRRSDGRVRAAIVNTVYDDIFLQNKSREKAVTHASVRFNVSEDYAAKVWDRFMWSRSRGQTPRSKESLRKVPAEAKWTRLRAEIITCFGALCDYVRRSSHKHRLGRWRHQLFLTAQRFKERLSLSGSQQYHKASAPRRARTHSGQACAIEAVAHGGN
jgi:hypothetical protein